jgi:hypothetical protein
MALGLPLQKHQTLEQRVVPHGPWAFLYKKHQTLEQRVVPHGPWAFLYKNIKL